MPRAAVFRDVTLVLTDGERVLGSLPPFRVPTPWWADVAIVVDAAREQAHVDVTVLRLLHTTTSSSAMGGAVAYLAEVRQPPTHRLDAWHGRDPLEPTEHRVWWATPGALADAVEWACGVLGTDGVDVSTARQQRTWNLSVLVLLETSRGRVWLKAVPPFLADEEVVLAQLSDLDEVRSMLPTVLGHDPGRRVSLLADVPGVDLWDADAAEVLALGRRLIAMHRASHATLLLQRIAPDIADRRTASLAADFATMLESSPVRHGVIEQVATKVRALDVLPDVIIHSDPHPQNWRAIADGGRVLLDWGDAAVGNPLFDLGGAVSRLPTHQRLAVLRALARELSVEFDHPDLSRAIDVLPLAQAIFGAVVYANFCANIEPDEQVYHRDDVTDCIRQAVAILDG